MKKPEILEQAQKVLGSMAEVLFAYVHGSVFAGDHPRDVDVAVYLDPAAYAKLYEMGDVSMEFAIPLEMRLEGIFGMKADVQVLNGAPLSFRHRVVLSGQIVVCRDQDAREAFECLTRVEYFDFQPRRREYLQEAFA